ncbi:hypothetical protein K1719_002932 [Acacia pycnantha]|nr:hypothetical protein K1719_002932 [Acacia pycnantha]
MSGKTAISNITASIEEEEEEEEGGDDDDDDEEREREKEKSKELFEEEMRNHRNAQRIREGQQLSKPPPSP